MNFQDSPLFFLDKTSISSAIVINCFTTLLFLTGLPAFYTQIKALCLCLKDINYILNSLDDATSRSTPYNPRGNG